MIGLVCEKNKFSGKNNEQYYTLTLATLNNYVKDYRIVTVKDAKTGLYVPRKYFVDKDVYDSVNFGKFYDFEFGCDNETGVSRIIGAKSNK